MRITNETGSIETTGGGRIALRIGPDVILRGGAGIVVAAGGQEMFPLAGEISERSDTAKDRCGIADRLFVAAAGGPIGVEMVWSLYRDQPAITVQMTVTNRGPDDLRLDRLVPLRGLSEEGGFAGESRWPSCRVLNQPMHWHLELATEGHCRALPARAAAKCRLIGARSSALPDGPAVAMGIAEAASSAAEISFQADGGRVGVEWSAILRTCDRPEALLRLPVGKSFTCQRLMMIRAASPNAALTNTRNGFADSSIGGPVLRCTAASSPLIAPTPTTPIPIIIRSESNTSTN